MEEQSLTKEEKEALVNKRLEEIRRKNEALERRHAEILADKKAAEQDGRAVNLKCTSNSPPLHHKDMPVNRCTPPPDNRPRQTPPSRGGRGRGRRIYTTPQGTPNPGQPQQGSGGVEGYEGQNKLGVGRGKRLAKMSAENRTTPPRSSANGNSPAAAGVTPLKEMNYGPPPEPSYSFLADKSREGPLLEQSSRPQQQQQQPHHRHPRNYGGPDFSSVRMRVKNERQQQEKRYSAPVNSKWEMELKMTGKERRDYVNWKKQREEIEKERINRHKTQSGEWKREWDVHKTDDYQDMPQQPDPHASSAQQKRAPSPPQSRRMEPARRPAGRIGSGRFVSSDDSDVLLSPPPTPPHRGGGSGRFPMRDEDRTTSTSPPQQGDGRSFEPHNEALTIRVDNAEDGTRSVGMRGREGPRRGGGDYGGYNRGGRGGRGNFDRGRGWGDFGGRGGGGRGGYNDRNDRNDRPWNDRPPLPLNERTYPPNEPAEEPLDQRVPLRGKRPRGRKQHRPLSYTEGFTMVTITTGPGLNELSEKEGDEGKSDNAEGQQAVTPRKDYANVDVESRPTDDGDDEWEDAEEEVEEYFGDKSTDGTEEVEEEEEEEHKKRDHHNSSAESLERFIQEHTLDVDMETGTVIRKDKSRMDKELSPLKTNISPQSQVFSSPDFMKTPEGHEKVLDWWTEVRDHGEILSPEARAMMGKPDFNHKEAQNLNMSLSSSEPIDSPTKDKTDSPAKSDLPTKPQEEVRSENAPEEEGASVVNDKQQEFQDEATEAAEPTLTDAEKELESIRAREEEVRNEIAMNERRLAQVPKDLTEELVEEERSKEKEEIIEQEAPEKSAEKQEAEKEEQDTEANSEEKQEAKQDSPEQKGHEDSEEEEEAEQNSQEQSTQENPEVIEEPKQEATAQEAEDESVSVDKAAEEQDEHQDQEENSKKDHEETEEKRAEEVTTSDIKEEIPTQETGATAEDTKEDETEADVLEETPAEKKVEKSNE